MARFTGLIGLVAIVLAAFLFSANRSAIQRRVVLWGVFLQFSFAFIVLKTPFSQLFFAFSQFVNALLNYSSEGARFSTDGSATSRACASCCARASALNQSRTAA